jgi:hypothetical protein
VTGEPLVHRNDDEAVALANRLKEFHTQTQPVIDHYTKRGKVATVNANQTVDKVRQAAGLEVISCQSLPVLSSTVPSLACRNGLQTRLSSFVRC